MGHIGRNAAGHIIMDSDSGHIGGCGCCAGCPCPGDCCGGNLTLVVSGFSGDCAYLNHTYGPHEQVEAACSWGYDDMGLPWRYRSAVWYSTYESAWIIDVNVLHKGEYDFEYILVATAYTMPTLTCDGTADHPTGSGQIEGVDGGVFDCWGQIGAFAIS
jgi:hypothetical protein